MNINKGQSISRRDFIKLLSRIGGSLFLGMTGFIRLFGTSQNGDLGAKPTSTWKPVKTATPTLTRRPIATSQPTSTLVPTWEGQNRGVVTPTPSLTRRPRAQATNTSTPTATVNQARTSQPTSSATYTRRPFATNTATSTPRPTSDRSTATPTQTMSPTVTPDVRGLLLATPGNFEVVLGKVATAINAVSVIQEGGRGIDKSDLIEDFLDFNREKYDAYMRGERPYRYLRFQQFRRSSDPDGPSVIRAVIDVQNSVDGSEERKYVDAVLEYLNKELKVDISKLDLQHRSLIARDIGESNRFTCIKFLRFIWGLFGDVTKAGNGMFPQVYQARIINAGQLSRQIESGKSIFDPTNIGILQASLIKNTDAIAAHPEDLPDFFDGRIVIFFRPEAYVGESGHVGVAKLFTIRDFEGKLKKIVSTFIEVDGNTGQAYYGYRIGMDDFRNHLFMDLEKETGVSQRIIGWMFNRSE